MDTTYDERAWRKSMMALKEKKSFPLPLAESLGQVLHAQGSFFWFARQEKPLHSVKGKLPKALSQRVANLLKKSGEKSVLQWKDSQGKQGYLFFLDQTLALGFWDTITLSETQKKFS